MNIKKLKVVFDERVKARKEAFDYMRKNKVVLEKVSIRNAEFDQMRFAFDVLYKIKNSWLGDFTDSAIIKILELIKKNGGSR